MACFEGLVVLVLMVTAEAYVGDSSKSSFCRETEECLLYDLVCKTAEYEVRNYTATKWVSTNESSFIMEAAIGFAFRRLHRYISGDNNDEVEIDMTAPVVVKIEKRKWESWRDACYTVSFLLPSAYQERPPTPTNREVVITDMPDMNVYVRSFGYWIHSYSVSVHSRILKKDLDEVQASYDKEFFYAVGYDSPLKFRNRHNEIWYQVEGVPVCPEN